MTKKRIEYHTTSFVSKKRWDVDDDYLVVEVQVFESDGFKEFDTVEIIITKVVNNNDI